MAEHTPTPWEVEGPTLLIVATTVPKGRMRVADIRGWGYLTGKGDGALGLPDADAIAIQEANAAFIVKAVNSHDDLIAALGAIRLRTTPHIDDDLAELQRQMHHIAALADAAIAKVSA